MIRLRFKYLACVALLSLIGTSAASPEDPGVAVQLDISNARPRRVEEATERRIAADYRLAWANLAAAMDSGSPAPLEGLFVGSAKDWLTKSVNDQQKSQMSIRYLGQNHNLQAVFYSPEGDVIELHDTAEYQRQVLSSGKLLQNDRGVHHYVVLMTPAADRWVIRDLLEVSKF